MTYREIKDKFKDFFESKGHTYVSSASLIPEHDASVLLTTAGMQQFKPYFAGKDDPYEGKAISIQKCFRTSDIDEIGDETHLTFFEMFGNFGFDGQVSKEMAINWAWEFLTDSKWMDIDKSRISATYYDGNRVGTKEDIESKTELTKIGVEDISAQSDTENFWGPTGDEGPCGPTVEFYVDGIEVWNVVFNKFWCTKDNKLNLSSRNLSVDTGMGLERLMVAVTPETINVYETDVFMPIVETIKKHTPIDEAGVPKSVRIVLDHLRGSIFLISDHIQPSNKEQGYILRRLLRRAILHLDKLEALNGFVEIIESVINRYADFYPELLTNQAEIIQTAVREKDKFLQTVTKGRKELEKIIESNHEVISGNTAFDLFATYGLPIDYIKEEAKKYKLNIDEAGFEKAFKKHQEISRAGAESKFGGHGLSSGAKVSVEDEQKITRLHTATHLLHSALLKFLGENIKQAGSDLNTDRARFDFTFDRALTFEEKEKIQNWVNEQINKKLPVKKETKPLKEALAEGAIAFFKQKYPDIVDVYTIYNPENDEIISKELCGGPHVENTSEIGKFEIIKEQSSSSGVRRIRAIIK